MNNKKKNEAIDKLLCYMKQYTEKEGCTIKNAWFDFEKNKPEDVLYGNCNQENNSQAYKEILEICKINPNEFEEILNYCRANEYICCHHFNHVEITEKGSARATSVMNRKFTLPTWVSKILETVVAPSIVAIISSIITTIIMRKMGG